MYKIFIYVAMFFIFSFCGWIMEEIHTFPIYKKFVNRGFLIGPVLPIYGTGGILITLLLTKYKEDPVVLFCMAVIICSILEYLTSYVMEKLFKTRWWDYSNKLFNINGRVCLSNMVAFGIVGVLFIYFVNPFLMSFLYKINPVLLKVVVSILFVIFLADLSVSTKIIYNIKGVGITLLKDSTEEINNKVKEALMNKGKLTQRVAKAFPNFKISNKVISKFKRE